MKSLVDEPHSFILAEVIAEYELCMVYQPSPIKDKVGDEHPSSSISRFKCYDEYELCVLALSRLPFEVLISSTLRDKIQVRFRHHSQFDDFPG